MDRGPDQATGASPAVRARCTSRARVQERPLRARAGLRERDHCQRSAATYAEGGSGGGSPARGRRDGPASSTIAVLDALLTAAHNTGSATKVRSVPSVGDSTTTSSPGFSHTRGSRSAADSRRGPGGHDVARLERHQLRQVRHERRDRVDRSAVERVLHLLAVQASADPDRVVGSGLVGRHEPGPQGAAPSKTLPGIHCGVANWIVARGEVVQQHVAGDVARARRSSVTSFARLPITNATSAS